MKKDLKNFDMNNTDEKKIIDSNYVSAYKGKVVIRTNMTRSGAAEVLFVTRRLDDYEPESIDKVRHEYGHTEQLKQLGI